MSLNKKIWVFVLVMFSAVVVIFLIFEKTQKTIVFRQQPESISQIDKAEELEDTQTSGNENIENVDVNSPSDHKKAESGNISTDEKVEEMIVGEKSNSEMGKTEIENRLVSFGFSKSTGRKIDTVIIHSTYNALGGDEYDVEKIIDIYRSYGVSAHYLIARNGTIYRLVEEKNIAYHAGVSQTPDGRSDVNKFSIGIEMIGNKSDGYTGKQYDSVSSLVKEIKARYSIKYVLGHKDIAPDRKDDPWKFDFDKLK